MEKQQEKEYSFTMRELPETEKPYERCIQYGAGALTDAQLLAVVLKTGTREQSALVLAQRLLSGGEDCEHAGLNRLFSMQYPDYLKLRGIGPVKAVTLLCVVELAKRLSLCHKKRQLRFEDSRSVAEYYIPYMRGYHREHFVLLLLDGKNALIRELEMSVGTVNASLASPREIMIEALRYEAVAMIVLHNHPSGDSTPSGADVQVTKRLNDAAQLLDLRLHDHIIIGADNYTSMRALGLF